MRRIALYAESMSVNLAFASAYRQLQPVEKTYVDGYVQHVEREADRVGERISHALYRPISEAIQAASRGMLDKPLVRAAITERINQIAADTELTAQRVIKELMAMGFASLADYQTIGEDGMPYFDFAKATPQQMSALKVIKYKETMTQRGPVKELDVQLHDKQGALEKLMKYMGLMEPDNSTYRQETARPVQQTALPSDITVDKAADRYARAING